METEVDLLQFFEASDNAETYSAGESIFRGGEEGRCMYVVRTGSVDLMLDETLLTTVGEGEIFGELALIDQAERSATARAQTDCEVLPIDEGKFLYMVHHTPYFSLDLLRIIAGRLRAMNRLL